MTPGLRQTRPGADLHPDTPAATAWCPGPGLSYIDWDLAGPKGRPQAEIRATRDEIARCAQQLLSELNTSRARQ